MSWVSIAEYRKKKGINSVQIIYNQIATGKLKKDVDWREVEVVVKRKQMFLT